MVLVVVLYQINIFFAIQGVKKKKIKLKNIMLPLFGSELIVFRAVFQNNEGGAWDSVEKKNFRSWSWW